MRRAYAQTAAEKQQAEEEGIAFRDQFRSAYPFHPALLDVMRERWDAIPDFQPHPWCIALPSGVPSGCP